MAAVGELRGHRDRKGDRLDAAGTRLLRLARGAGCRPGPDVGAGSPTPGSGEGLDGGPLRAKPKGSHPEPLWTLPAPLAGAGCVCRLARGAAHLSRRPRPGVRRAEPTAVV